MLFRIPKRCLRWGREDFSEVTGGRALSFHGLSMGETAAIPKGGMRRGQNSPVDKSLEKTSPGALERKKSFPAPGIENALRQAMLGISFYERSFLSISSWTVLGLAFPWVFFMA